MPDIFDEVAAAPKRDIFDEVSGGDIFDEVRSESRLQAAPAPDRLKAELQATDGFEEPVDPIAEERRITAEIEAGKLAGGVGTQAGIGIASGMGSVAQGVNKAYEMGLRYGPARLHAEIIKRTTGWDPIENLRGAAQVSGQAAREVEALGQQTQGPAAARKLAAGSVSLVPAMAVAPLGFPAMVAASGAQSFGGVQAQAEEAYQQQGFSPEAARRKALAPALGAGVVTALVTRGFGATGVEGMMREGAREGFKGAVKEVFKQAGMEAAEEATDQAYQAVIEKLSYNPELTTADAIGQVIEAGLIGGALGGGVTLAGQVGTRSSASSPSGIEPTDAQERVPTTPLDNPQFLFEDEAAQPGMILSQHDSVTPPPDVDPLVKSVEQRLEEIHAENEARDAEARRVAQTRQDLESAVGDIFDEVQSEAGGEAVREVTDAPVTTELVADGRKVVATEFPVADIEVDPVLLPQFKGGADAATGSNEREGSEMPAESGESPDRSAAFDLPQATELPEVAPYPEPLEGQPMEPDTPAAETAAPSRRAPTVDEAFAIAEKMLAAGKSQLAVSRALYEAGWTPGDASGMAAQVFAEAEQKTSPDAAAKEKKGLQDFGEKLGGARKDKAASLAREISDDELATLPLSEIWPKSDVDGIEDIPQAALATAVRDTIPAKPRKGYKLTRWVAQVKLVRGIMRHAETMGVDGVLDRMKSLNLQQLANKVRLLQSIPREAWGRIGDVEFHPDAYSYGPDGSTSRAPVATAGVDGKRLRAASIEELMPKVMEAVGIKPPERQSEYQVRGRRDGVGGFSISRKSDPLHRALKTFSTPEEALAFGRDKKNHAELEAAWAAVKESDNVKETDVRRGENRPRVGGDYRRGENATPEMFLSAFGFRGVEFGNWVSQGGNTKDRQGMLNAAFDGLMDLAAIVGIPPKAISLNGTLGLGLGSRGHGWSSAHYEPDTIVINLTKTRGAGSLAHEWFHALDNYFQRQRNAKGIKGRAGDYITQAPETYYEDGAGHRLSEKRFKEVRLNNPANWTRVEGVRPEVAEAFAELVDVLDASPMAKRASLVDKGKSGGYWSRIIERAARSFENYVIAKMQLQGFHNDYLANVTSVEDFARDKGRYPYLLAEEIAPVSKAFDELFSTIEVVPEDAQDVVDAKLSEWITKLGLKPGALYEGVTGAPVWLAKDAARGVLQVVRAAYRGGKALAAAIEEGLAWLRARKIAGFNEEEAKAWLTGEVQSSKFKVQSEDGGSTESRPTTNTRRFSRQIDAAPWVSEATKRLIENKRYEVVNIRGTHAAARDLLSEIGVDEAVKVFGVPGLVPDALRAALGVAVMEELGKQETAARLELTPEGRARAAELSRHAAEFMSHSFFPASTGSGQFNAVLALSKMSPAMIVHFARIEFAKAASFALETHGRLIGQARAAIQSAQAKARKAIETDASVNAAAERAVNAATAGDPEVQAVVNAQAAQDQSEQVKVPGLTPQELAEVLRRHYDNPQLPLGDILEQAGMEQAAARAAARKLDAARKAAVEKATSSVRARIRRINSMTPGQAEDAVDALIRRKLREKKLTLGKALRQGKLDGRTLGEAIVADAGLTGPEAEALKDAVNRRVGVLTKATAERELEKLQRGLGTFDGKGRKLARVFREALDLFALGAFDDAKFDGLIRERLGLKELDADDQEQLRAMAERLQAVPEDQLARRQEITHQILRKLAQLRGVSLWDLGMAAWYANALSGPGTHATNILSNTQQLAANIFAQTVRHPATMGALVRALGRGTASGGLNALHILHTGNVTGPRLAKLGDVGALDAVDTSKLDNAALRAVADAAIWALRQPHRFLGAADMVFFTQASEVRQMLAARVIAKETGKTGRALAEEVGKRLATGADVRRAALDQAHAEGYAGLAALRRRNEIILATRGEEIVETGTQFGLRTTFNNKPHGWLGAVAEGIGNMAEKRFHPGGPRPLAFLHLIVPFRNIVANVLNEAMNLTPAGNMRAARAASWGLYGEKVDVSDPHTREDIADLHVKGALGTAGIVALLAYALAHKDDEDFDITLQGPQGTAREAWRAQGGAEASIKLGGVRYGFKNSPAMPALALVGGVMDAVKYRNENEDDLWKQTTHAAKSMGTTVTQMSFLSSLADLLGAMEGRSEKGFRGNVERWAARTTTTFVVPNLLRQMDRAFDPTVYEADGALGTILQQIPVARREGRPAINGFGERLTRENGENWARATKPDPEWRTAAALDLAIYPRQLSYQDRHGIERALTPAQLYEVVRISGPQIKELLRQAGPDAVAAVARVKGDLMAAGVPERAALKRAQELVRAKLTDDVTKLRDAAKAQVVPAEAR